MINKLFCKIFGHKIEHAGFCPFTKIDYDVCTKCTKMMPSKGKE